MPKITRQFSTNDPASLRRDLFRLAGEIDKALATIDQRLDALESAPAAYAPSLCVVQATSVAATTTDSAVAFSAAAVLDTDGYHDPSSNNTRLTAPFDGVYEVIGALHETTTSTTYEIRLRQDGSTALGSGGNTGTLNDTGALVHWEGALTAGQYFELMIDATGSVTAERIIFSMRRLDR